MIIGMKKFLQTFITIGVVVLIFFICLRIFSSDSFTEHGRVIAFEGTITVSTSTAAVVATTTYE